MYSSTGSPGTADKFSFVVRRVSSLVVVSLLLALLGAVSAEATFPGRPGRIVFDTPGAIWSIAADGHGGPKRIGEGTDPSFSPDGQLIAFEKGDRKLMVMRDGGGGIRTVYTDADIGEPCFSADGKTLFFVKDTSGEGYGDIWSVPLAGGEARRLTHTGSKTSEVASSSPEAAANGRFLVFQRDGAVWTMRPDGSRQKELTRGSTPSVSPDSREVVLARNDKLVIIGAGGGGERVIDPFTYKKQPQELTRGIGYPVFSPDGHEIAFTFKRTDDAGPHLHDTKRIEVYSLRTHKLRILTQPSVGGAHPDWQPIPVR